MLLFYGFDSIIKIYQNPSEYVYMEDLYSFIFNSLFFSSQTGRSHQTEANKFWQWISQNCPSSLNLASCLKPLPYSPSSCAADYSVCMQQNGHGFACPYDICRSGVRSYGTQCMLYITCFGTLILLIQITLLLSFPVYMRTRHEMATIPKIAPSKRYVESVISASSTMDSTESTRNVNDVTSTVPLSTLSSDEDTPSPPYYSCELNRESVLNDASFSFV